MQTARYRAQASAERPGEFAALNPAQDLDARFTPQGLELRRRSDDATPKLAMALRGAGYGERLLEVSPGVITAQDQRIEIHRTISDEQSAIRNPQSMSGTSIVPTDWNRALRSARRRAIAPTGSSCNWRWNFRASGKRKPPTMGRRLTSRTRRGAAQCATIIW